MKYIILLLIPFLSFAQVDVPEKYWLDDSNFEDVILPGAFSDNDETIVVEFWAKFNDSNSFKDWNKVKNITHYYRVDIAKAPNAKKEYKVRMAPTIIVFKDGIKEEVYKAGLDLECPVDLDELQEHIDELKLGSQF